MHSDGLKYFASKSTQIKARSTELFTANSWRTRRELANYFFYWKSAFSRQD